MTNNEIIISEAIKHGIYTKAEAQAIVAAKGCLPIHTFAEWKKAGYSVCLLYTSPSPRDA